MFVAGILCVLLNPTLCDIFPAIKDQYPHIASTISAMCKLCSSNGSHLPMAVPEWPSKRTAPLMQLCHGTPGLMLLITTAGMSPSFAANHWSDIWLNDAMKGAKKTWEQGLLSKGGGLCHGIAGNAWPLILLSVVAQYNSVSSHETSTSRQTNTMEKSPASARGPSGDEFLGQGLALLLECENTEPFAKSAGNTRRYSMPDHPYSLFGGLAGTICAWADACIVVEARLRQFKHSDGSPDKILTNLKGVPCLSGNPARLFTTGIR